MACTRATRCGVAAEAESGSPRSGVGMEVRELVEELVKAMVDQPEEVVVTEVEGTHSCVLELSVSRSDVGKVIGISHAKKSDHAIL